MTLSAAHEVLLRVRDGYPRMSQEREALAVVSNALDEMDALRARVATLEAALLTDARAYLDLIEKQREATA